MTNRDFAKDNKKFHVACKRADTKPTMRQASKFRRRMGKAAKV